MVNTTTSSVENSCDFVTNNNAHLYDGNDALVQLTGITTMPLGAAL